jgi:hypothetical protein
VAGNGRGYAEAALRAHRFDAAMLAAPTARPHDLRKLVLAG